MKMQYFLVASFAFLLLSCSSSPNLENDSSIHLNLPIQERDDIPYTIALADDGKVWQWKHNRGNEVEEVQQLPIVDVHSIGFWWKENGWALKNDGTVTVWNLKNPADMSELEEKKKIKKVSGSNTHLAYIFTDGSVGYVSNPFSGADPAAGLTTLKGIRDLAAGQNCTIACTEEGEVYVVGSNDFYLAFADQKVFEEPYLIEELSNVSKVGITSGDFYKYAIDEDQNIFLWGMANVETGIYKSEHKAHDLLPNQLFIKEDGSTYSVIRKGPRMGVMEGLTFREQDEFKNALYYEDLRNKWSYLEVDSKGQVIYRDLGLKTVNGNLHDDPINPKPIEGLRLDLRFFEQ